MKLLGLILFSVFSSCLNCKSQTFTTKSNNDLALINNIFDRIELQGVDSKQDLLYGHFFFDKDKSKLEKLKSALQNESYKLVRLDISQSLYYILHVEKIQIHTRQSLYEEGEMLRKLAEKFTIEVYDGFDVGNVDPTKPLISSEEFEKFMNTKKGNELFDFAIKLYDLEINENAEIAFKECIKQKIKPDTSSFKLGNILIALSKVEEGLQQLEQATKFNPNYFKAFFNLGAACYSNGQFQKSINFYQEADKLKPNDDGTIYGIAAAQYAIGQFDKSLENCKKALELNNQNENAKMLLQMLKRKIN